MRKQWKSSTFKSNVISKDFKNSYSYWENNFWDDIKVFKVHEDRMLNWKFNIWTVPFYVVFWYVYTLQIDHHDKSGYHLSPYKDFTM